jgi:hypothetical protein
MAETDLESQRSKTSFGKLVLSTERSQPVFSIGHGTRASLGKLFHSSELSSTYGKSGPGPKYVIAGNKNFKLAPHYSIGRESKTSHHRFRTSYAHFNADNGEIDPIHSKNYTMRKSSSCQFTKEKRTGYKPEDVSPGP